jgi:hypothetical protein
MSLVIALALLVAVTIAAWVVRARIARSPWCGASSTNPLGSEAQLRAYVESELMGKVIARWPELTLRHRDASGLLHVPPPNHALWWVLSSPRMDPTGHLLSRHYLIEASPKEREFLIWFGELTGVVRDSPRDVMRPAIHVRFEPPSRSGSYSLGAVVQLMLEHEYTAIAEQRSPLTFPMNGGRY